MDKISDIIVKYSDDSVWSCELKNGRLVKRKQLEPPTKKVKNPKPVEAQTSQDDVQEKSSSQSFADELKRKQKPPNLLPKDSVFKRKIWSVLRDNSFDRVVIGQKKGKLDMKRLYKAAANSDNVFKAKKARLGKNYTVSLVVDCSGSMGIYRRTSTPAALFLAETFQDLKIDYQIIKFSNWFGSVQLVKFGEQANLDNVKAELMHTNGGTNTFSAVTAAISRIRELERDSNHILFLITDGDPDTFVNDFRDSSMKRNKILKKVRDKYVLNENVNHKLALRRLQVEAKDVQIIPVLLNTSIDTGMKHQVKLDKIEELKPEILKILSKAIKRV